MDGLISDAVQPARTAPAPPRVVRALYGLLSAVDVATAIRRQRLCGRRQSRTTGVRLLAVYRHTNGPTLERFVIDSRNRGWQIALWALDRPYGPLAAETVGVGAGTRFANLNRAASALSAANGPTIVIDDDVMLTRGDLADLVTVADAFGLHVAQPAHTMGSHWAHWITRQRPFTLARATTFVEIGPVVCFSQEAWARLAPFAEAGMGWGTELAWAQEFASTSSMGIVDAVAVRHLHPMGVAYDAASEHVEVDKLLRAAGATSWASLQRTTATYRWWSRVPPLTAHGSCVARSS